MSLKYRIAGIIFVLEAIMMAVVLTQTTSSFEDSTRRHLADAEQVALNLLSPVARRALLTHDYAEMQPYLQNVSEDPRVLRAMLVDHRGIVVASLEAADIGSSLPDPGGATDRFWRRLPISNAGGVSGAVAVEFSNERLVQASAQIRRDAIAIAVFGMAFIAVVGIATGVLLTRKLERVAGAARRLTQGDLTARSHVIGNDEIGHLGRTFDGMAMALDEDRREIEHAHHALRKSEEHLRFLVDNAPISIHEIDLDGRLTSMSRPGLEMMGFSDESAIGNLPLPALADKASREEVRGALERALAGDGSEIEFVRTVAESKRTFRLGCYPITDSQGCVTAILGLAEDISERRQAEEALALSENKLHQAQKMESIGLLAGGVAHDFNNILTVINGYSELMLDREQFPDRERVEEIAHAANRAASLTQQLLAFSRRQVLNPRVIDLNTAVAETVKMVNRVIGEDIQVKTDLEPSLGAVKADQGQIHQVIMNLSVNARDAMPRGGTLSLATANVDVNEADATRPGLEPGAYVRLVVSDDGVGMTGKVAALIFEPFYTTKEVGRGTGLGLSTVYGIVKQSDGFVYVSSQLGKGSSFEIFLPRTDGRPDIDVVPSRTSPPGTGTILLVEDDRSVRDLARDILVEQGYDVLEAHDGQRALEVLQSHDGSIELVITDLVMPRMGGPELAQRVGALRPDAKVLFTTGYFAGTPRPALSGEAELLKKPFSRGALLHRVGDVLGSVAGSG